MLTLYGFGPVGNSLKPMLALYEKQLPFVAKRLDMARFEQHQDWYKAINPRGMVPSLSHDGRVIIESTVICEYLEDVFPERPLRPSDPAARADMRVWTKWVDEHFCWCVSTIAWDRTVSRMARALTEEDFTERLRHIPDEDRRRKWLDARNGLPAERLDDEARKVSAAIRKLEESLAAGEWLVEGGYSLADICVFAIVNNMPTAFPETVNETLTPNLVRWANRIRERPATCQMLADGASHSFRGPGAPS